MSRGRFQIHWSCECGDTLAYSGPDLSFTRGHVMAIIDEHAARGHEACTADEARRIRNSERLRPRNRNRHPKRPYVANLWMRKARGFAWHRVALKAGSQEPSDRAVCGRPVDWETWEQTDLPEPPFRCILCEQRGA